MTIKKRLHAEVDEEAPHSKRARVTEALVAQVMLGTLYEENGRANEWVSQYELPLLRELTGLPLTSARLHRQPRKKMARPPKLMGRARLSILIGQDPRDAFVVEENTQEVEEIHVGVPVFPGVESPCITRRCRKTPREDGEQ